MDLIFGRSACERRVAGVERLLCDWREKEADWGQLYLEYEPVTPRDRLVVEDLAITMLMNSRVAAWGGDERLPEREHARPAKPSGLRVRSDGWQPAKIRGP